MDTARFQALCTAAFEHLRKIAPNDTGNLSNDALRMEYLDENTAHIYVDENIAPYMPYTNEPWVSSYWKGKQNPNLFWFDQAVFDILSLLEQEAGGTAEREDTGRDLDIEQMAKDFQNKRGDYTAADVFMHSTYISDSGDPSATFASRIAMLK